MSKITPGLAFFVFLCIAAISTGLIALFSDGIKTPIYGGLCLGCWGGVEYLHHRMKKKKDSDTIVNFLAALEKRQR